MNYWITLIIICVFGIETHAQKDKRKADISTLNIMTYNLKFASPSYKPSWDVRREMQVDLIQKYQPDIIGTQEGLKMQVDYLMENLTDYVVIGEGRQGGDNDEHMAIFYKKDKFRLREMGSFQLSETPDVIGSGPAVNPRMVTWARLAYINIPNEGIEGTYPEDYRGSWENTREFYVFNTHYFNGGKDTLARINASRLIVERLQKLNRFGEWQAERPIFLMGDFNCRPGSAPYQTFVGNEKTGKKGLLKNSYVDKDKIDWILYRGKVDVLHYEVIEYNLDGAFPSDHKPIYVKFGWPNQASLKK